MVRVGNPTHVAISRTRMLSRIRGVSVLRRCCRRLLCSQAAEPSRGDGEEEAPAPSPKRMSTRAKALMHEMLEKCQPDDVLRIVIDCDLEKYYQMSEKELKDLSKQIVSCYGHSMRVPFPCRLHLTGVEEGGPTERALLKHFTGYQSPSLLMKTSANKCTDEFNREDLVYLSPYSNYDLREVRKDKVYVIGGVVDKRVTKRLSENAAMNLRVTTARLPIKEYMMPGGDPHKLDLPIDVVVKILLAVHHSGDWKQALREHFPKRKGWVMRDW